MAFDPSSADYDRSPVPQNIDWDTKQALLRYPDIAEAIAQSSTLEAIVPQGFELSSTPQERAVNILFETIYSRTTPAQPSAPQRSLRGALAHRLTRSQIDQAAIIQHEMDSVRDTIILVSYALARTKPRAFGRQYAGYIEESRDYDDRLNAFANAVGNLCTRYNIDLYGLLRTQNDPSSRDGLIGTLMDRWHIFG